MAKKRRESSNPLRNDPITAGSVLLSLLVALAFILFNVENALEGLIISLCVTIIGLILQLIYDTRQRGELDLDLRAADFLRHHLTKIAHAIGSVVNEYPNTEIAVEAERKFIELEREIEALSRGTIDRDGLDYSDLMAGTVACKSLIQGITNISGADGHDPSAWWNGQVGKRYWEENVKAMARRVTITRIFIYSTMNDSLKSLITMQSEAGVQVRLLPSSSISPSFHINITVWDAEVAWEARMNARGVIVRNLMQHNLHDVNRLLRDFAACESYSVAFSHLQPDLIPVE